MLPRAHRLTSSAEFTQVVRRGRRTGRRTLTVHALAREVAEPARAGFVVSKAVGGSVVRHRVARQLRHQLLPHVATLPDGCLLVVRASPAAAAADSATLGSDLASALDRVLGVRA